MYNLKKTTVLLCVLSFYSCQTTPAGKQTKTPPPTNAPLQEPVAINKSVPTQKPVKLTVYDKKGWSLKYVSLSSVNAKTKTNLKGQANLELPVQKVVPIKISKPGFAPAFRSIDTTTKSEFVLNVQLVPAGLLRLTNLDRDQNIKYGSFRLAIPANTLVDAKGQPVKKAALRLAFLRFKRDGVQAMPGSYQGKTMKGDVKQIESFGAFSLSSDKEPLKVAEGKSIQVDMPLQGKPLQDGVSLWRFDTKKASWVESRTPRARVQTVARRRARVRIDGMSWWNLDKPLKYTTTIWVKNFTSGKKKKQVTLDQTAALGFDYYGSTYAKDIVSKVKQGVCLNVKIKSRVRLVGAGPKSILYKSKILQTKNVPARCDRNPEDGLILASLNLHDMGVICGSGVNLSKQGSANNSIGNIDRMLHGGGKVKCVRVR